MQKHDLSEKWEGIDHEKHLWVLMKKQGVCFFLLS